ncbi:MAG TPA: DUF2934 domain-containing protein [Mycobacterium sp.]|nr:DUF2934 domain-containing protein [Mycobacterium sp.]HUH71206.1 DUF2934 domain-containing protein [Mycobacterium sp.]
MAANKPPSDKPAVRKVSVPKRSAANRKPVHDAIAKRAHEIYEAQGGGNPDSHWLQAERELAEKK